MGAQYSNKDKKNNQVKEVQENEILLNAKFRVDLSFIQR